jgi:hypothetical protein
MEAKSSRKYRIREGVRASKPRRRGAGSAAQLNSVLPRLGVRMGFVVDVHELSDGSVGVFLGGGEGLVAEEFLDGPEVGAVSEQVSGESMTQGVWVQIPIDVGEADIFLDDAPDGTLRKAATGVIEEDGFTVRGAAAAGAALQEKLFANGPVSFERFLGFSTVRDDTFLVAFAAHPQHFFAAFHVGQIEAGEFADPEARSVEKLEDGAIAAEEQGFFVWKAAALGTPRLRSLRILRAAIRFCRWRKRFERELIEEAVHLFGG